MPDAQPPVPSDKDERRSLLHRAGFLLRRGYWASAGGATKAEGFVGQVAHRFAAPRGYVAQELDIQVEGDT